MTVIVTILDTRPAAAMAFSRSFFSFAEGPEPPRPALFRARRVRRSSVTTTHAPSNDLTRTRPFTCARIDGARDARALDD